MKRLLHAAGLATTLMWHAPASGETLYSCGQGTVRAVEAINETVIRKTVKTRRDDGRIKAFVERTDQERRRWFNVSVELKDRLYVSQSAGDPQATLDPLRLAVGDPIDICVNGAQMILELPDGTDYRAAVVRQTFVVTTGAPRATR